VHFVHHAEAICTGKARGTRRSWDRSCEAELRGSAFPNEIQERGDRSSMALWLSTVRIGSTRQSGEGLRLGTVRFLPRGVKKSDYQKRDLFDVWLPNLAPSRELLHAFKEDELPVKTFFTRYRAEMKETEARQLIELLAQVAQHTPLSIACYCEDESRCHRSVLAKLIREAGRR
jgi:uncharacterized protein YeaO (DUF488 family)